MFISFSAEALNHVKVDEDRSAKSPEPSHFTEPRTILQYLDGLDRAATNLVSIIETQVRTCLGCVGAGLEEDVDF